MTMSVRRLTVFMAMVVIASLAACSTNVAESLDGLGLTLTFFNANEVDGNTNDNQPADGNQGDVQVDVDADDHDDEGDKNEDEKGDDGDDDGDDDDEHGEDDD